MLSFDTRKEGDDMKTLITITLLALVCSCGKTQRETTEHPSIQDTLPDGFTVGDVVWAQWKPNEWCHGKVAKASLIGFHVAFDDGDRADLPPSLIVADRVASAEQVRVGTRVLAPWTDGRHYPGTVTRVAEGKKYSIQFDDGDRRTTDLENLRLLSE